nr:CoA transferase [Kribbella shirazensis]
MAGVVVLDFSQFLAGPVAALRLADLGARVIKIERPVTGEIGRTLAFAGRWADEDTISFHAMNRNKGAVVADLKDPADLERVKSLVARADVVIHNFRPGVMERIGLDYESVRTLNPGIVYAAASGYGTEGPWSTRPGQDLLAQSISGLTWATRPDRPTTVGLSLADHLLSCHLAQGVTALLVRKVRTGQGGLIESSLLEAMLDLQANRLTTHLNTPARSPDLTGPDPTGPDQSPTAPEGSRHTTTARPANAHTAVGSSVGEGLDSFSATGDWLLPARLYPTANGHLAIAPTPLATLTRALHDDEPAATGRGVGEGPRTGEVRESWLSGGPPRGEAGEVEAWVAQRLLRADTGQWVDVLGAAGIDCAPLLTLDELLASAEFAAVEMTQTVVRPPVEKGGRPLRLTTTRSPIRIDGEVLRNDRAAPRLGAQGNLREGAGPLLAEPSGAVASGAGLDLEDERGG